MCNYMYDYNLNASDNFNEILKNYTFEQSAIINTIRQQLLNYFFSYNLSNKRDVATELTCKIFCNSNLTSETIYNTVNDCLISHYIVNRYDKNSTKCVKEISKIIIDEIHNDGSRLNNQSPSKRQKI